MPKNKKPMKKKPTKKEHFCIYVGDTPCGGKVGRTNNAKRRGQEYKRQYPENGGMTNRTIWPMPGRYNTRYQNKRMEKHVIYACKDKYGKPVEGHEYFGRTARGMKRTVKNAMYDRILKDGKKTQDALIKKAGYIANLQYSMYRG